MTSHTRIHALFATALIAIALLPACSDLPQARAQVASVEARAEHGVVERIVVEQGGAPSEVGTVIGGIAGGVLGHQIGHGGGNTAATIAGALGGAYAGHEIQKAHEAPRYRITVRLDNGAILEMKQAPDANLRVGDRVSVVDDRIYRE